MLVEAAEIVATTTRNARYRRIDEFEPASRGVPAVARLLALSVLLLSLSRVDAADCADPEKSGITHSDSLGVPSVSLNYYAVGTTLCFKKDTKVYECTANGSWKTTYKDCADTTNDVKDKPAPAPGENAPNDLLKPMGSGYLQNNSLNPNSEDVSTTDIPRAGGQRPWANGSGSSSSSGDNCMPPEAISAIQRCQSAGGGNSICQTARKGAACMRQATSACGSCGACVTQAKSLLQQFESMASSVCASP